MRDRVVEHPNRYKLTPVSGDVYDLTPEPGIVTEEGTNISKATLLSDTTAAQLGLSGDPTVDEALLRNSKPRLIQKYDAAGTFPWTAPDLFNGATYDVGIWMIGGGGSGGALCHNVNTNSYGQVAGGGSGYAKYLIKTVTPGSVYTAVVGAGGIAVTASSSGSDTVDGNNGGTTSFDGVTVSGGTGGSSIYSDNHYARGADGGQGSSAPGSIFYYATTPCGCIDMCDHDTVYRSGLSQPPLMALNPFDAIPFVPAAGGSARKSIQTAVVLPSGNSTSASVYETTGPSLVSTTASDEPGAGGGSAQLMADGTTTSTSAKGADGCILIYARTASQS